LSAADLLNIRLKYGFKQTDMEAMLSTGPKTWTRWERGKIPQSKAADKLIRLIASDPEIAKQLMDQAGVVNAEASLRFDQFEESTKALTRVAVREELQKVDRGSDAGQYADRVADRALEAVRNSRHQAARWGVAA
jgi:transcriptional regulator with XRE-family HTH domain